MATATETTADERAAERAKRSDADLLPGSRWRVLRGDHAGALVELTGFTRAQRVRFHPLGGGAEGANNGNGHFDESAKWVKSKPWFLANYTLAMPSPNARTKATATLVPDASPAPAPQLAWRQTNKRPPKPAASPAQPQTIVVGEVNTRDAEFNVSLERISPDRAREWLNRGGLNRHLSLPRVDVLAEAIKRGEWQVTGDTIKLDQGGRVRDGQHRLHAIAASGVVVQALVVFGVAEEAFDVMDTGRARSIADVVGMRGYKYRNALAAAVRNLITFETIGRLETGTKVARTAVTSATTLKYLREHPDEVESAMLVAEHLRLVVVGSGGMWASLLVLFRRLDSGATDRFIEAMLNGNDLSKGSPLLVLRNRLTSDSGYWATNTRSDKENLAASIVKAWNAWRKGETMETWRSLTWRSSGKAAEAFPVPQ
jgi:hypothetical protein